MRPPTQYDETIAAEAEEEPDPRMVSMMICTRLAGRAVIRVVGRCNEAQENCILDLSDCQLMQVPDAVYHLMRHTELKRCDLSDNVITKIPPKFAVKFSTITDLNLSHNQMAKLPDEIADLGALERLNISYNTFISIPDCIFKIKKLRCLDASNNRIVDVDTESVEDAPSLETLDISNNPLSISSHNRLAGLSKITVTVSPREKEDWEDLSV